MEKIIVSACLLGDKCRYDGHSNYVPLIKELKEKYEIIVICPEVNGGLSIPRTPSEIKGDRVVITYLGIVIAAVNIKDLTLA